MDRGFTAEAGPERKIPRVALLIESSRSYGRGILRGIADYLNISGNVTWNGQPVAAGAITFEPLDMADRLGDGFAHIRNGEFDASVDRRGHFGGPHKVIITGSWGRLIDPRNPDSGTRPLFTPYETTVNLPKKRSTQDFSVE